MRGPITWRTITAPSNSGANDLLLKSQGQMSNGLTGLQDVLKQQESVNADNVEAQRNYQTNQYLDAIAKFGSADELQEAQASGALENLRSSLPFVDSERARGAIDARLQSLVSRDRDAARFENEQGDWGEQNQRFQWEAEEQARAAKGRETSEQIAGVVNNMLNSGAPLAEQLENLPGVLKDSSIPAKDHAKVFAKLRQDHAAINKLTPTEQRELEFVGKTLKRNFDEKTGAIDAKVQELDQSIENLPTWARPHTKMLGQGDMTKEMQKELGLADSTYWVEDTKGDVTSDTLPQAINRLLKHIPADLVERNSLDPVRIAAEAIRQVGAKGDGKRVNMDDVIAHLPNVLKKATKVADKYREATTQKAKALADRNLARKEYDEGLYIATESLHGGRNIRGALR